MIKIGKLFRVYKSDSSNKPSIRIITILSKLPSSQTYQVGETSFLASDSYERLYRVDCCINNSLIVRIIELKEGSLMKIEPESTRHVAIINYNGNIHEQCAFETKEQALEWIADVCKVRNAAAPINITLTKE